VGQCCVGRLMCMTKRADERDQMVIVSWSKALRVLCRSKIGFWAVTCAFLQVRRLGGTR
jgi:hypothetical protein